MMGDTEQNLFARDLCFSVKGYKYLNFTSCKVVSAYPIGKFGLEQCFFYCTQMYGVPTLLLTVTHQINFINSELERS